jgi:hypothetical protein
VSEEEREGEGRMKDWWVLVRIERVRGMRRESEKE